MATINHYPKENKIMKKYILKAKKELIFFLLCSTITAILNVSLSYSMGNFVTAAAIFEKHALIINGLVSIASIVLQFGSTSSEGFFRGKFVEKCNLELKNDYISSRLFNYQSWDTDNDINMVENTIPTIGKDYFLPICLISGFAIQISFASIAMIFLDTTMFIIFLIISLIPLLINPLLKKRIGKFKDNLDQQSAKHYRFFSELFNGLVEIKISRNQLPFFNLSKKNDISLEKLRLYSNSWDYSINRLTIAIGMTSQIICMLIAAFFILLGRIQVGGLTSATQLLNYIFPAINAINANLLLINSTRQLRNRVSSIINFNKEAGKIEFENGDITIRHLEFTNSEKKIFDNLDIDFYENTKTALIGKSGRGKSILIKLILKIKNDYNGKITINDKNLQEISNESLYDNISYMPQTPAIFKGSLLDNITLFSSDLFEEKSDLINDLITLFGINHLSFKELDSENISGGEKQRIGIIRTIIQDKPIKIFDEPTSALDPETSKTIFDFLFEEKGTLIVITHNWEKNHLNEYDNIIRLV